jgi:glycosyltransferase involved in cell wall biosynthesis
VTVQAVVHNRAERRTEDRHVLTVLMATRNRSQILRQVLEAYCHVQQPSSDWKLIVIDNGSTDETPQVAASFANRLPLKWVMEPRVGKNFALNAGVELAEGDLTVFTDDDAFPHADWLVQLRKAADAQPAYTMFGGAIRPHWEVPAPRWLQWLEQNVVYGVTIPTLNDGPIPPHLIVGPNMMIRSSVFQSGARFDTSIGPRGLDYAMGSETELLERLSRQGHKAWHVGAAVVEHLIQESQMDQRWVLSRAIRFGRGIFRLRIAEDPTAFPYFLRMPLRNYIRLFKPGVRIAKSWLSSDEQALLVARWKFNYLLGIAIEAWCFRHERHSALNEKQSAERSQQ